MRLSQGIEKVAKDNFLKLKQIGKAVLSKHRSNPKATHVTEEDMQL